jgi:hypothetical protein
MGVRRGNAQAAMSKSRTNGHLPHVAKSLGDPSEYLPPQDLGTAFAVHVKTSPRISWVPARLFRFFAPIFRLPTERTLHPTVREARIMPLDYACPFLIF